jgi:hypothetical protein
VLSDSHNEEDVGGPARHEGTPGGEERGAKKGSVYAENRAERWRSPSLREEESVGLK